MTPDRISMAKDTFYFKSPRSPAEFIDLFRRYYGPTMNAFEAAEKDGKTEELRNQLVGLANAFNQSKDGGTAIAATFMRVTADLSPGGKVAYA